MLIDSEQPGLQISLTATMSVEGLTLSGHDVGPRVEEVWGDLDYEYWLNVAKADCVGIPGLLGADLAALRGCGELADGSVLELLERAFRCRRFASLSEFRSWLDDHDIPSTFHSRT